MTQLTLNPNSTATLGSGSVVPSGTAHAALSDSSDATYVLLGIPTHTGIGFPTPSIPAGAIVQSVTANARVAGLLVSSGFNAGALATSGTMINNVVGIGGIQEPTINWENPKTIGSVSVTGPDLSGITWEVDLKKGPIAGGGSSPIGGGGAGIYDLRLYKLTLGIVYVAKPVVNVTAPDHTITNTSFPLIDWDNVTVDDDGGAINIAQVRVFNSTQYGAAGFDPATSTAADETLLAGGASAVATRYRVVTKLPNADYRAYVRIAQFGKSNYSNFDFIQWTQNVIPPANPSSVVATADSANGRISIDVTGSDTPVSVDAVDVQRSEDGGTTWTAIRDFSDITEGVGISPVSGRVLAYDFEAPIGVSVTYRARTRHDYSLGEVAVSDWVSSNAVTWTSGSNWWIKHPTDWSLNLAVIVRTQPSHTRARRQGVFAPMGRAAPIVVQDSVRTLPSGDIGVRALTDATALSLTHLADANTALLIQAPPNNSWGNRWVRLGDLTRERIVDGFSQPWLVDNFPWQEVEAPAGAIATYPGGGPSGLTLPFTLSNTTLLH